MLAQDTVVLDTWFSSGLWPFSTMGWPHGTEDMRNFYPNTMLETGYDILFFWVARMVMMGLELTGKEPFNTVYLHGLVRTADGKRMSKSRPEKNIDPLDMIDQYGADALRFYLVTAGGPGNDIKVDVKLEGGRKRVERIEGARNFANKLWNAARFVLGKITEFRNQIPDDEKSKLWILESSNLANRWIYARGNQVVRDVRRLMDDYQYGEAGKLIYDYIWNDFCDWYLEFSKLSPSAKTIERLIWSLDASLRLLHPFMPFVTEEIWQKLRDAVHGSTALQMLAQREQITLPHGFGYPALMLLPYPRAEFDLDDAPDARAAIQEMGVLQEVIRAIRNARAEYKVEQTKRIPAIVVSLHQHTMLDTMRPAIASLARVDEGALQIAHDLRHVHNLDKEQVVTYALGDATVYLPLAGLVDLAAEKQRLSDELASLEGQITRSDALLHSDFGQRAPAAVIEKEKAKLADLHAKRDQVRERLVGM
jgi:valyl-tRNA synthetase